MLIIEKQLTGCAAQLAG